MRVREWQRHLCECVVSKRCAKNQIENVQERESTKCVRKGDDCARGGGNDRSIVHMILQQTKLCLYKCFRLVCVCHKMATMKIIVCKRWEKDIETEGVRYDDYDVSLGIFSILNLTSERNSQRWNMIKEEDRKKERKKERPNNDLRMTDGPKTADQMEMPYNGGGGQTQWWKRHQRWRYLNSDRDKNT